MEIKLGDNFYRNYLLLVSNWIMRWMIEMITILVITRMEL